MQNEYKFDGGRIILREKGEMFDQKTGKKNTWPRALKCLGGKVPVVLEAALLHQIQQVLKDEQVVAWLNEDLV